jgi:hypothetical protein
MLGCIPELRQSARKVVAHGYGMEAPAVLHVGMLPQAVEVLTPAPFQAIGGLQGLLIADSCERWRTLDALAPSLLVLMESWWLSTLSA